MTISTNNADGVLTVAVEGAIDVTTVRDFEQEIKKNLSFRNRGSKINSIILDFSKLDYISSAGLRVILMLGKQFNQKGGLVIKNYNDTVREIFENTGFTDMFEVK